MKQNKKSNKDNIEYIEKLLEKEIICLVLSVKEMAPSITGDIFNVAQSKINRMINKRLYRKMSKMLNKSYEEVYNYFELDESINISYELLYNMYWSFDDLLSRDYDSLVEMGRKMVM